jgi:signal recognition particle GTPase
VLVICDELKVSIKYLGTGEGLDDLAPFHPQAFVWALFA